MYPYLLETYAEALAADDRCLLAGTSSPLDSEEESSSSVESTRYSPY